MIELSESEQVLTSFHPYTTALAFRCWSQKQMLQPLQTSLNYYSQVSV